jgi:phosphoglycolate phosphatase
LADTLPGVLRIYNQLAAKHGFAAIDDPQLVRRMTTREFLQAHRIPIGKVPLLMREIAAAQRQELPQVRLHAQLPEALHTLRRGGACLGIVSSNSEENIRVCLRANGMEDSFSLIVGYSRILGKHRALRRVMKEQGATPPQTIYFGDEARDAQAARAAGVPFAAVGWGINTLETLASYDPARLFPTPADLAAWAERWIQGDVGK